MSAPSPAVAGSQGVHPQKDVLEELLHWREWASKEIAAHKLTPKQKVAEETAKFGAHPGRTEGGSSAVKHGDPNKEAEQRLLGLLKQEGGENSALIPGLPAHSTQGAKTLNDITEGAGNLAGEVAGGVLEKFVGWFGESFGKAFLYVVLVGGGAALTITGISRAFGLHPVHAAKTVGKVVAAGAVA